MTEHIPYLSREGNPINFESKRFKFWLENVPPDIRRLEYDLWKRYRIIHHLGLYQHEHKKTAGRFMITPEYSPEQEKIDWQEFSRTFLTGEDRKKRFSEVVSQTRADLPKIFLVYNDKFPEERIDIIALTGSNAYGPRKENARFSDTDVRFLFDVPDDTLTAELMPNDAMKDLGRPYHIIGTGTTDVARGPHADIHWLLYPHYPLLNRLDDLQVKTIIGNLVQETRTRADVLRTRIAELEKFISDKRQGLIRG